MTPQSRALLAAALLAFLVPVSRARADLSFDFFYDNLQPFGEWVDVAGYGLCWHPTHVLPGWAPYTDGYWAFTDGGWTWVSYEDFGGIVYHYGRWINTDDEGWCWVPDYDWAPAWVSWRDSDDYVGWAPLSPECHWEVDTGVSTWVDAEFDIGPACFHFCRIRDFGAPVINAVLLPAEENVTVIEQTVNVTNITVNHTTNVIVVGGPRYSVISKRSARPIPALKLVPQTNVGPLHPGVPVILHATPRGNALFVPTPVVHRPAEPDPAAGGARTYQPVKRIEKTHVRHGWEGVSDTALVDKVRHEMRAQVKMQGGRLAPAAPIASVELKAVPQKPNVPVPPHMVVEVKKPDSQPSLPVAAGAGAHAPTAAATPPPRPIGVKLPSQVAPLSDAAEASAAREKTRKETDAAAVRAATPPPAAPQGIPSPKPSGPSAVSEITPPKPDPQDALREREMSHRNQETALQRSREAEAQKRQQEAAAEREHQAELLRQRQEEATRQRNAVANDERAQSIQQRDAEAAKQREAELAQQRQEALRMREEQLQRDRAEVLRREQAAADARQRQQTAQPTPSRDDKKKDQH